MSLRNAVIGFAGAATVAAAAQFHFTVPGTGIPQTGQTLAVLAVGGLCGAWRGGAAVLAYLLGGALGLPLFADGGSGLAALTGPTGGFLLGFVPAAVVAGRAGGAVLRLEHWTSQLLMLSATMLAAHGVILLCGWGRLALLIGYLAAWQTGVEPFLPGALMKSVSAAIVVACGRRLSGLGA